ncbi:hypothetical protein ABIB35_001260 [Arthrobacter sp. UYP6]|uniref:heparinase II/III family protein n=1 Tax=Arthrobacter sp. UYP6 TaxID=1756378 RepID=UPI003392C59E
MFTSEQLTTLREIAAAQLPAASTREARIRAEKFLDEGVIHSVQFGEQAFENGLVWNETGTRANGRYLHGFLFFIDWTRTILQNADTRCDDAAHAALRIVSRWIELHPSMEESPEMAYHDETTAQRLINLLSLDLALVSVLGLEKPDPVKALMKSTAEILARPDFHAGNNNHGMFQDLALLYYSLLCVEDPAIREQYFGLAMRRLKLYFTSCFTPDGVHVENTPTYHLMVSRQLANVQKLAQAAGHEDSRYYSSLIQDAETYAAHALMPDGTYPPISDTQQIDTSKSGMGRIFPGSAFEFASTLGRRGIAPVARVLVLPDSGYAIYRSSWADPDAVFAFFSAAYNADYHKHSDDLSFFLRSGGRDLLSESGPYGYDYKHPFSRYAYSQYSHNSLIVDGASLPRTDTQGHKVQLHRENETSTGFTVLGINDRYFDTTHSRRLHVEETNGVPSFRLNDNVKSSQAHKYQLLWNLGLDVRAHLTENGFDVTHKNEKVMELRIEANVPVRLSLHKGERKPRPLGWRFPRFGQALPTQVVVVHFEGSEAKLTTDIRLSGFEEISAPLGLPTGTHHAPSDYTLEPDPLGKSIEVSANLAPGTESAFRLYRDSDPVVSTPYSSRHVALFEDLKPGRYRARIFARSGPGSRASAFTTQWCEI